ncbi:MAG: uroporphyrinogen-III C-methyltransferase [Alphaproteobacteria bacterium]
MDYSSLKLPTFEPGWVWLTGAGPGDAGLLTLHALNGLRQADVVVYDALVGDDILGLVGKDTVLEFAGKRGGKPSPIQSDISKRLISLASEGKRVLRLKGGDPFVFGRGGEEALTLVEADVPFRIIPGISAGVGGLAYAGMPLTHRDVNAAVTFVTGHALTGKLPDSLDWAALAKACPVLVIYMGMKHMDEIRSRLISGGKAPNTPVAIVTDATLPSMRVVETDLENCVEAADENNMRPPSLLVIGETVRLRAGLDWMGAMDAGRKLIADPLGV